MRGGAGKDTITPETTALTKGQEPSGPAPGASEAGEASESTKTVSSSAPQETGIACKMNEGRGSQGFQDINQYLTTKSHGAPRAKVPLLPS